jgi:hypothetical protein
MTSGRRSSASYSRTPPRGLRSLSPHQPKLQQPNAPCARTCRRTAFSSRCGTPNAQPAGARCRSWRAGSASCSISARPGPQLFLPRTKFGQTLDRACTRAGIPRCTPNDLRRTYSTWLRADGVPNELSAPTMGHKDTRMLDRVYARLPPELLRERLLAALGRCSAGAVNPSETGAPNGRTGQRIDDATSGELAPRAGIEPATHGLTVRCSAS